MALWEHLVTHSIHSLQSRWVDAQLKRSLPTSNLPTAVYWASATSGNPSILLLSDTLGCACTLSMTQGLWEWIPSPVAEGQWGRPAAVGLDQGLGILVLSLSIAN